jgi:glycosyltransferase involved in cell wall biosynthesis
MYSEPILHDKRNPLVSVAIFNYNYGRYLSQCFDSVFSQTYGNIEICFSDNASTDGSWDIALEYARKHPGTMTVTCNRKNFGSDANFANCLLNVRGKYIIELCSDDALMPDYIEKCVNALEANPDAGFAMVHRTVIDEHGNRCDEPPFYNQTCIIPGPEQAAVYMMAAVNPSISQIMYNVTAYGKTVRGTIASRWYGTRLHDFTMCCESPIVYIKEPLLMHRVHSQSDSSRAAENLIEIIGPYVLQHQYAEIADQYNLTKAAERLPQSMEKLGKLCLRYCVRFLLAHEEQSALRYFHLGLAIIPSITADLIFSKLQTYWTSDDSGKASILEALRSSDDLATRSVSYDPPPGSIPIEV